MSASLTPQRRLVHEWGVARHRLDGARLRLDRSDVAPGSARPMAAHRLTQVQGQMSTRIARDRWRRSIDARSRADVNPGSGWDARQVFHASHDLDRAIRGDLAL